MSLADYLAKHYLTADSKSDKKSKKRRQQDGTASGLTVADDDALGWDPKGIGNVEDDAPLHGEQYVSFHHYKSSHSLILSY